MSSSKKHRILLDECLAPRTKFYSANRRFNLKHIVSDFKQAGLKDPQVYELAISENRMLATDNLKDFTKWVHKNTPSVIKFSDGMTTEQKDKKLCKHLKKLKDSQTLGHITHTTNDSIKTELVKTLN